MVSDYSSLSESDFDELESDSPPRCLSDLLNEFLGKVNNKEEKASLFILLGLNNSVLYLLQIFMYLFLEKDQSKKTKQEDIFTIVSVYLFHLALSIIPSIWYNITLVYSEGKVTIYADKINRDLSNQQGRHLCCKIENYLLQENITVILKGQYESLENLENKKEQSLKNIKELVDLWKNPKKFDEIVINNILRDGSIGKETLQKLIELLRNEVKNDPDYQLSSENFECLTQYLSSPNFQYYVGDSEHLKVEVHKILVSLIKGGAKISRNADENIKNYLLSVDDKSAEEFPYVEQRIDFLASKQKINADWVLTNQICSVIEDLATLELKSINNDALSEEKLENAYSQRKNSSYWYSDYDVKLILESYFEDRSHDVIVAAVTVKELPAIIREYQDDKKRRLIALHTKGNHWVSLVMMSNPSRGNEPLVLYKDSFGLPPGEDVKEQFSIIKHNVFNQQEKDSSHCGIFAIANLKKIADSIKKQDELAKFIEDFEESREFIDLEEAKNLREEKFADLYLKNICANKYKEYISVKNNIKYWMKMEGDRLDEYRGRFSGQNIDNRRAKEQLAISYNGNTEYLVISLAEKLNDEKESGFISNTVLTQVVKIAQSSKSVEVIEAVVEIYNKVDLNRTFDLTQSSNDNCEKSYVYTKAIQFFIDNLFPKLSFDLEFKFADKIKSFDALEKLDVTNLFIYFQEILINENNNDKVEKVISLFSVKCWDKLKQDTYMRDLIDLESLVKQIEKPVEDVNQSEKHQREFLEKCQSLVEKGKKLTANCFKLMQGKQGNGGASWWNITGVKNIIKIIIENGIQTLPERFIVSFKDYFDHLSSKDKLKILKSSDNIVKAFIKNKLLFVNNEENSKDKEKTINIWDDIDDIDDVDAFPWFSIMMNNLFLNLHQKTKRLNHGNSGRADSLPISDFLDLVVLVIESSSVKYIPAKVIEKIKVQAAQNTYAANVLSYFDKNSLFARLQNPRLSIKEKREQLSKALDAIEQRERKISFLERISETQPELWLSCVEALIELVSNESETLDLSGIDSISMCFFREVYLFTENINAFDDDPYVINGKDKFKRFLARKPNLGEKPLQMLVNIAKITPSREIRTVILDFLNQKEKSNDFLEADKLFYEIDFTEEITEENLEKITGSVAKEIRITDETISSLVNAIFKSEGRQVSRGKLEQVLFDIVRSQGASWKLTKLIFDGYSASRNVHELSRTTSSAAAPSAAAESKAVEGVISDTLSKYDLSYKSLLILKSVIDVDAEEQLPSNLIDKLCNILSDDKASIHSRILATTMIANEREKCLLNNKEGCNTLDKSTAPALTSVALEKRFSKKSDELNQIVFELLLLQKQNEEAFSETLQVFYKNFKERLEKHLGHESLEVLDHYVLSSCSIEAKYYLLNALNRFLIRNGYLDTKFLKQGEEKNWCKCILHALLVDALYEVEDCLNRETIYTQITYFVMRLSKKIATKDSQPIEKTLLTLIRFQEKYKAGLKEVCDVLWLLSDNSGKLEDIQEVPLSDLESRLWRSYLKNQTKSDDSNNEELDELQFWLQGLRVDIVNVFFKRIDKSKFQHAPHVSFVKSLIHFFVRLEAYRSQYKLSDDDIESFIIEQLPGQASLYTCFEELYSVSVSQLLVNKLLTEKSEWSLLLHDKITRLFVQFSMREDFQSTQIIQKAIMGLVNQLDVTKSNCRDDIEDLCHALDIIYEYDLIINDVDVRGHKLINILQNHKLTDTNDSININKAHKLSYKVHQVARSTAFEKMSDPLTLEEVCEEIKKLNLVNKDVDLNLNLNNLVDEYNAIEKAYERVPKKLEKTESLDQKNITEDDQLIFSKPISKWKEEHIKSWSKIFMSGFYTIDAYQKLAVVKRAVEVFYQQKITPREVQILSVLLLLNSKEGHGRLAQINTGEGKTMIIAMLAVIKALEGVVDNGKRIHQVDIITSSSELAKPHAEECKGFFELFGLSVDHNNHTNEDIKKEAYKANIVYGAASDFQGDILRDEYHGLGTRSGRECRIAIVDEVDSMLIDGKNHLVMLSSPMPGMDYLEPLLVCIWTQLSLAAQHIVEDEEGNIVYRTEQEQIDVDGEERTVNIDEEVSPGKSKADILKEVTEAHLRKILRDETSGHLSADEINALRKQDGTYPKIEIPAHLRDFVLNIQLSKWIDSAIAAMFRYDIHKQYILLDGQYIAPVDASNTGIVQENMIWTDGLHQFLQLKHGCKLTPESLTSNLLSNVSFFKRYKDKIYGLTGTLGVEESRKLLHKHYKVDSVIIPPFKTKRYKELNSIITDVEGRWYHTIVQSCLNKLEQGRGVLVITNYISEIEALVELLMEIYHYPKEKIKVYETEKNAAVAKQQLQAGEIILATNIAGRGTDIRPSAEVEGNGGLHVCITFLPLNKRVEDQNIGRTSRTGNQGTAQFILLDQKNYITIEKLRNDRDKQEKITLAQADDEINKVLIKDAWFEKFREYRLKLANNPSFSKNSIKALEERFAIWLKEQEDSMSDLVKQSVEVASEKFQNFTGEVDEDIKNETLVKNPTFYVLEGNDFYHKKEYSKAIEQYEKAIELDKELSVHAYYNCACVRVASISESTPYDKARQTYEKAIGNFQQAKSIIEDKLKPVLSIMQRSTNAELLSTQLQNKLAIYNAQLQAIEIAIGQGDGAAENQLRQLTTQREDGAKEQCIIDAVEELIDYCKYNIISLDTEKDNVFSEITEKFETLKTNMGLGGENQEFFLKELEDGFNQKRKMSSDVVKNPMKNFENMNEFLASLLTIQEEKLTKKWDSLKALEIEKIDSSDGEQVKRKKREKDKIDEDISKLERSIEEIKRDQSSGFSEGKDHESLVKRLTRYRNIFQMKDENLYKRQINEVDHKIIQLYAVSNFEAEVNRLIKNEDTLSKKRDFFEKTKEALQKRKEESKLPEQSENQDRYIKEVKECIDKIDENKKIIACYTKLSEQEKILRANTLVISFESEIQLLEAYRKDLKGLTAPEKDELDRQIKGFYLKDAEEKIDPERTERINKGIIGISLAKGEYISINLKPIVESLPDEENPDLFNDEINEYENNGCLGFFELKEIKPIPWLAVITVFLIGLAQVIAGAVLMVYTVGIGASIGLGLLLDGVSDMITAVRDGIINRNLDLVSWGVQKAISLVVLVLCAGLSAIKAAAKVGAEAVKVGVKAATEATKQTVQSAWKLVAKKAGIAIAKGIAKECVTQLADYGVSKLIMPSIEEEIKKLVEPEITKVLEHSKHVEKMLKLDAANGNRKYEAMLNRKALAILSPPPGEESRLASALKQILQGVASSQVRGFSSAMKVYAALEAIHELRTILPKFIQELEKAIEEIAKLAEHEIQQKETQTSCEQTEMHTQVSDHLPSSSALTFASSPGINHSGGDIDPNKAFNPQPQAKQSSQIPRSPENLVRVSSQEVAHTCAKTIQLKLLKPCTDHFMSLGIDKAFERPEKRVDDAIMTRHQRKQEEAMKRAEEQQKKEAQQKQKQKENREIETKKQLYESNPEDIPAFGFGDIKAFAEKENVLIVIKDENGNVIHTFGKQDKNNSNNPVILIKSTQVNERGIAHYTAPPDILVNQTSEHSCVADVIAAQMKTTSAEIAAKITVHAPTPEDFYPAFDFEGDLYEDYCNYSAKWCREKGVGGAVGKWDHKHGVPKDKTKNCDPKSIARKAAIARAADLPGPNVVDPERRAQGIVSHEPEMQIRYARCCPEDQKAVDERIQSAFQSTPVPDGPLVHLSGKTHCVLFEPTRGGVTPHYYPPGTQKEEAVAMHERYQTNNYAPGHSNPKAQRDAAGTKHWNDAQKAKAEYACRSGNRA